MIVILAAAVFFSSGCGKSTDISATAPARPEMKIAGSRFVEPELNNNTMVMKGTNCLGPISVYMTALLICLICFASGWAISMCTYSTLFTSAIEEGMKDAFVDGGHPQGNDHKYL